MKVLKNLKALSVAAAVSGSSMGSVVQADMINRSFCVWDPIGANGPLFNVMKSAKPSAMKWGINLELKAYTDEKIASDDFKEKLEASRNYELDIVPAYNTICPSLNFKEHQAQIDKASEIVFFNFSNFILYYFTSLFKFSYNEE